MASTPWTFEGRSGARRANPGLLTNRIMTLEEFLDARFDLPESGQWAELDQGEVALLQPPDLEHGNTILNLSKAIAAWAATHEAQSAGCAYACFDLGLLLSEAPDTVWFPAVSFFAGGERFAESDKQATTTVPRLVVELASSAERRARLPSRVARYLEWGVQAVWVIDPRARTVQVIGRDHQPQQFGEHDELTGAPWLPGFRIRVATLFEEPVWWTGKTR